MKVDTRITGASPQKAAAAPPLGRRYLLSFGSNLGDRYGNCQAAKEALMAAGVAFYSCSRLLTTAPLPSSTYPCHDHGDYLNFIADTATDLEPGPLYQVITAIEDRLGHARIGKWQPRHMDIDILFAAFNTAAKFSSCTPLPRSPAETRNEGELIIPHPGFWQRPFLVTLACDDLTLDRTSLAHFAQ